MITAHKLAMQLLSCPPDTPVFQSRGQGYYAFEVSKPILDELHLKKANGLGPYAVDSKTFATWSDRDKAYFNTNSIQALVIRSKT